MSLKPACLNRYVPRQPDYIQNRETQSLKRKKEIIHIVWAADGTQVHLQNSNTVFFLSFCTVITHSYYLKNIPVRSGCGSPKHSCTLLTTYLYSNLKSISNYSQRKSHHHPPSSLLTRQDLPPCPQVPGSCPL